MHAWGIQSEHLHDFGSCSYSSIARDSPGLSSTQICQAGRRKDSRPLPQRQQLDPNHDCSAVTTHNPGRPVHPRLAGAGGRDHGSPMLSRSHAPGHARNTAWAPRRTGRRRIRARGVPTSCKATDVQWLTPNSDPVQRNYDAIIVLAGVLSARMTQTLTLPLIGRCASVGIGCCVSSLAGRAPCRTE